MALHRFAAEVGSLLGREATVARRPPCVLVDLDAPGPPPEVPAALAALPAVVVGVGADDAPASSLADVVVPDVAAAREVMVAVERWPIAAVTLALLLRPSTERTIVDGLVAESAAYSTLQAGPEHQAWLDRRQRRARPPEASPPVRIERAGEVLQIVLDRPHVRNALDAAMRDALLEALAVAEADGALQVELRGAGPGFCAGGDLDEFGTRADPATAHLLRLSRSIGLVLAGLADRSTARVHGACAGSGVELAAFCGRVVSASDATFALPELRLGLIPGAGGTVSVTRRIGRHRTAWLVLTGERIDAPTALAWGLADQIDPSDR